jgi:hypothetical protein
MQWRGIAMRHTKYTTQVYSLFGGGYVLEAHDPNSMNDNKRSPLKRRALVAVLVLSTAAGAYAAWNRTTDVWTQEVPATVMKLPGGFGMDDAVY